MSVAPQAGVLLPPFPTQVQEGNAPLYSPTSPANSCNEEQQVDDGKLKQVVDLVSGEKKTEGPRSTDRGTVRRTARDPSPGERSPEERAVEDIIGHQTLPRTSWPTAAQIARATGS